MKTQRLIGARLVVLVLIGLLATAAGAGGSRANRDVWYVVLFSGTPVGIVKDTWRATDEGVYYENYLEVTVSRLGTQMSMVARTGELDDENGAPVHFSHEVVVGGTRMLTTGERSGDSLFVRSEGKGFANEKSMVWDDEAVGQAVLDEHIRNQLAKGKTEFSIRTFDLQFTSFRTSRYRVAGEEPDTIQGHIDTFVVLEHFEDGADHPAITSWLDGDLEVRRVVLRQMGMEILIERVTADMLSGLELDPNFDVIRGSMITCEGYPQDPSTVRDVEFRIEFSRPIENTSAFNGPNQRVLAVDDAAVTLLVSREVLNEELATGEQQISYLAPDRFVQADHPDIKAVADSITASLPADTAQGGEVFVRAVARWVNGHIRKKGFGQGFASAVDVLKSREGDCTEHAVLVTALLRAGGVPARTAVGLVYTDGSLIGHMWTEAHVGFWRSVDALDPENNPVRIRIAASPDERALDETDVANAYSLVGGVAVEVQNYTLTEPE